MSRVVKPGSGLTTPTTPLPHEQIAMRAYEKWVKRGRPAGTDVQDWMEAEAELRAEMSRRGSLSAHSRR